MDSLKLSPQELDALTDEERNALFAVMERARVGKMFTHFSIITR